MLHLCLVLQLQRLSWLHESVVRRLDEDGLVAYVSLLQVLCAQVMISYCSFSKTLHIVLRVNFMKILSCL